MTSMTAAAWYRHRWPWFLMIGPLAAVLGGVATLWLALWSDDGLVAEDYYKQGLAVNRVLSRETLAAQHGYRATLNVSSSGTTIRLYLSARTPAAPLPEALQLRVIHPTRAGADQSIVLRRGPDGLYHGEWKSLLAGRFQLILEDDAHQWRLLGDMRTGADATELSPR